MEERAQSIVVVGINGGVPKAKTEGIDGVELVVAWTDKETKKAKEKKNVTSMVIFFT